MINKEQFLCFIKRVERTEKGIRKLEEAFENLCFREMDFCQLSNYADKIAFMLMGQEYTTSPYYESFSTDFWNILDKGYSEFEVQEEGDSYEVCFQGWEDFYNYYFNVLKEN